MTSVVVIYALRYSINQCCWWLGQGNWWWLPHRCGNFFLILVRPLIQYHTSGCCTNYSITVSVDLFCAGSLFFLSCQQRIVINGSQSTWLLVLSGVSRGTVLGPLLFLLYINDIDTDVTSEIRLFADDCILYRTIKSSAACVVLQSDISKLQSWACTWQMYFNPDKCHILPISRKRNETIHSYHLGQNMLSVVDCIFI